MHEYFIAGFYLNMVHFILGKFIVVFYLRVVCLIK